VPGTRNLYPSPVQLSVVIITYNEEANIGRTLASVAPLVRDGQGEIIVVDSGSTDRTVEIARQHGAKVFIEAWKGYAAQKNSAIEKACGDWILSLDADEEAETRLVEELQNFLFPSPEALRHQSARLQRLKQFKYLYSRRTWNQMRARAQQDGNPEGYFVAFAGFWIRRRNFFLGRWIKHGGFCPDPKLRLFRRGTAQFENRAVHEDVRLEGGVTGELKGALIHHSYPTLTDFIEHMNRYSSLGAEMTGPRGFILIDIVLRPAATFLYNYVLRLGFLDGREGLLLHLYHAAYVSWKYAKAWELKSRSRESGVGSR